MSAISSYRGQGATAICGPAMALLIRIDQRDPLVASLWPRVLAGDLPGVLGVLAGSGIGMLPDFGLSFIEPRLTRVLVRGSVRALVRFGDERTESVSAEHVTAWHEALFMDELSGITLETGKSLDESPLPLVAGVVAADVVEQVPREDRQPSLQPPAPEPLLTKPPEPAEPLPDKKTLTWSEPVEFDGSVTTGVKPVVAPSPEPVEVVPVAPGAGRLKDRVAWLDDEHEPAAPILPSRPPQGADRFGDTIRREPTPRSGDAPTPSIGPRVRAVRCPASHLNPPMSTQCRECGQPVDEHQIPEETEQPSLGVLRRDSTGESWALSRSITVIGREPRAAGPSATLIHTANASPDVSRIHAEIRLNGWHVEVTDRSTHGTQIINPGHDPVRLEKNLPVRILPGAQLVLAGEVYLRYEVK